MIKQRTITPKEIKLIRHAFQNRKYADVLTALDNSAIPLNSTLKAETLYYQAASNVLTKRYATGFSIFSRLVQSATTNQDHDYIVSGLKLLIACQSTAKEALEFERKAAKKIGHLPSASHLCSRYQRILGNLSIANKRLEKALEPRDDEWNAERITVSLFERDIRYAGVLASKHCRKSQLSANLKVAIIHALERDLNPGPLIKYITKLSSHPMQSFSVYSRSAHAWSTLGDTQNAIKCYEHMLTIPSLNEYQRADVLCNLVYLGSQKITEKTIAEQIRALSTSSHDGITGDLYFALAHVQELQGQLNSVVDSLIRANQLRASYFSASGVSYRALQNQAHEIDEWTQSKSWCTPLSSLTPPRIFVIGLPRSGSTLVTDYLARHYQIVNIEESDVVGTMARGLINSKTSAAPNSAEQFLNTWKKRIPSKGLSISTQQSFAIIDKTLSNMFYIGLIKRVFPNAHFLWISKAKDQQIWSLYRKNFGNPFQAFSFEPNTIHDALRVERELKDHWTSLGITIHEMELSEFLSNPKISLAKLITHAGLKQRDKPLKEHYERISLTNSKIQIRSAITSQSTDIEIIKNKVPTLFEEGDE